MKKYFLFDNEPITGLNYFTRLIKRIAKANKLGKLGKIVDVAGSHSLRKASAHYLYEKSRDLRLVQSFLKHKNINTTSKYLGLQEQEAIDEAISVLGY